MELKLIRIQMWTVLSVLIVFAYKLSRIAATSHAVHVPRFYLNFLTVLQRKDESFWRDKVKSREDIFFIYQMQVLEKCGIFLNYY